ncbi:response regulator, partial [bacterium]|nr:response regulator [bacterium]
MAEIQINNTRILVADDEEASLDIFREILEPDSMDNQNELSDLGELENKPLRKQTLQKSVPEYDLFTCRQSEEVVEAVENSITEKRPFAVAFLDVRMPPGPNGLWAAEQIRALDPAIEIVIVTAYSDVNPDDFGISLQPAHKLLYLKKPFSPQEIQQFARSLSSKWHVEQKLRASKEDLEMQVRSRTLELVDANEALKEDIIKREKTEKDLLTSEKRYRQIFENVLTPYYETSPDGTLLEISP